ncbi:MAG: hypothetical protein NZ600_01350, partial [Acidimicrobiales bacterium]|nr:hypothetical protein [Acidimicrobiales bacterium]
GAGATVVVVVVVVVVVEVVVGGSELVAAGPRLEVVAGSIAGTTARSPIDGSASEQPANTKATSTADREVLTRPAHHMTWA